MGFPPSVSGPMMNSGEFVRLFAKPLCHATPHPAGKGFIQPQKTVGPLKAGRDGP